MSLSNIYAKDNNFSGLVNVGTCGVGDIYFDIVKCEMSIEEIYGKEYIDVFYKNLGIDKDEFKSDYYRIMQLM